MARVRLVCSCPREQSTRCTRVLRTYGVQLLRSCTDEKKNYIRVRYCIWCTLLVGFGWAGAARPAGISGSSCGPGDQVSSSHSLELLSDTCTALIYWFLRLHALSR